MKARANTTLGGVTYTFEIDEGKDKEILHKAIVLSNPRKTCTVCKTEGYETKYFTTNKDKEGNIYINTKCECGARSKLGSYKTGGYFWHDYEVYKPKNNDREDPPTPIE